MIDKAIEFATKAHEGQYRKGTKRPYIVHPVEVGDIVATMTDDEEVISAAVLHDTIEDCEGITQRILAQEFSERVAFMVAQESEDKSKTWMERKRATIEHLRTAPREVQMIGLADKLSNMRDIDRDYPAEGENLWNRFRMKDKETIGWYYKGIRDVLAVDIGGDYEAPSDHSVMEVASHSFSIMSGRLKDCASTGEVLLLKPPLSSKAGLLTFELMGECMERGYEYTRKMLPQIRKVLN